MHKERQGVVYACKYNIIWCPKFNRKVLVDDVADSLHKLIDSVCNEYQYELLGLCIEPNCVNLCLSVDPQIGIHRAIKKIKAITSHELRNAYPQLKSRLPTLWTNSYFVTTDCISDEDKSSYIQSQKLN